MNHPEGAMTERAAEESPCDPDALAAAVRSLALEAHIALKGPHTHDSLAELTGRATTLRECFDGRLPVPVKS